LDAYVGVIGNQEGIDNLLRSVQYILEKRRITNIKFIIVGRVPHLEEMINLIKEMRLLNYVRKRKVMGEAG